MPEPDLGELDVPVTELTPEEIMDMAGRLTQHEALQQLANLRYQPVKSAADPAILGGERWLGLLHLPLAQDAEDKPGRIPELVGKVATPLKLPRAQPGIITRGASGGQGKSKGIGAVLLHRLNGVNHVPLRLAHLLALLITNETVEVDLAEGNLAGVLQPHHDHPGHPEEEDIVAGLHHRGGIEITEVLGVVRPAKG